MDAGKLVPDEIIIGIIQERLAEADCQNGYILDGVPRTIAQAEALEKAGVNFDAVVSIEISDEEIEQRMTGRRTCIKCGATYHVVMAPPQAGGALRQVRRCAGAAQRRPARNRQGPPGDLSSGDRAPQGLLRRARGAEEHPESAHHRGHECGHHGGAEVIKGNCLSFTPIRST